MSNRTGTTTAEKKRTKPLKGMAEVGEKVAEDQGTFDRLRNWTKRLMFHDNGPMTRELLQRPADFGLGKLPTRLAPDKVANIGLWFLFNRVQPERSPERRPGRQHLPPGRLPRQRWDGMSQGMGGLTPLKAHDRATTLSCVTPAGVWNPYLGATRSTPWPTSSRPFRKSMGQNLSRF